MRFFHGIPHKDPAFFVNLMIGIILILIGGIFTFANRIREIPDWIDMGPGIAVASDTALRGAEVFISTDEKGITTLRIQEESADKILPVFSAREDEGETQAERDEGEEGYQDEQIAAVQGEEHHLWICLISSKDIPINWAIPKQPGVVKNYELIEPVPGSRHEFSARETHKSSGSSMKTAFEITYGAAHFGMVEIIISEDPAHTAFHGNGIYRPRLPMVFPWMGYEEDADREELFKNITETGGEISDPDSMRLSINNRQMYFPILKIMTDYASLSLTTRHDLEPVLIAPKPEDMYPLISWTQYMCSYPTIQFRDKAWEKNANRNNLLGGIFVGLGTNVLLTFTSLHSAKQKKR